MRVIRFVPVVLFACAIAGSASAQTNVVDMVQKACSSEIDSYCSNVTPGNGRMLACFFAHEDKLSGQCLNALYDGMTALNALVAATSFVAERCASEIDTICDGAPMGDGRVAGCLLDNKADLGPACVSAIDEIELRRE